MIDPEMIGLIEDIVGEAVSDVDPAYTYKGSVATTSNLPSNGNSKNDLYQVRADGSEWVWDGTQWVPRRVLSRVGTEYIDSLWP